MNLRPYQITDIENVKNAYRQGFMSPIIVAPCGSGKSFEAAYMAKGVTDKGNRVMFMVHRIEIVRQIIETFEMWDVNMDLCDIGMVQTFTKHIDKLQKPSLIITDECFPAGTLVDGTPIDTLQNGDIIASYNHDECKIEYKPIIHIFKSIPASIVTVKLSNREEIICTNSHPIYTQRGYVGAGELTENDYVYRVPKGSNQSFKQGSDADICENWKSLLFRRMQNKIHFNAIKQTHVRNEQKVCIGENEEKQSDVKTGDSGKSFKEIKRNRSLPKNQMWKWNRINRSATGIVVGIKRFGTICRVCNSNEAMEKDIRSISDMLQGGYCNSSRNDCDRNRWDFSWDVGKTGTGQEEGTIFEKFRVDSIEIQESTSDGAFGGLCPDGHVYNIEVDGNNNYFANGYLVHNCHHAPSSSYKRIYEAFPGVHSIGFTATPCRLDGEPLSDIHDIIIESVSVEWLIQNNYLSPYKYYAPQLADFTSLKKRAGDYETNEQEVILSKPKIFGDVIGHYIKLAYGKKAICYSPTVKHSMEMCEAFNDAGIPAAHIDGTTPAENRKQTMAAFRAGDIKILCNNEIISEGVSVDDCEVCILLRKTASLTLFVQQSMRCMRYMPDKTAIIIDHVGNCLQHGFPDDKRYWSLDKKLPARETYNTKGELRIRQCNKCYFTFPTAPVCPNCGTPYVVTREEIQQIKEVELQEIKNRQQDRKALYKEKCLETVQKYDSEADCKNMSELQAYAKMTGRKPGWAYFIGKHRGFVK